MPVFEEFLQRKGYSLSISNKVNGKFASDQTNSNNSNNSKFYIDNANEQIDCEVETII